jgi:hypothetical protein
MSSRVVRSKRFLVYRLEDCDSFFVLTSEDIGPASAIFSQLRNKLAVESLSDLFKSGF